MSDQASQRINGARDPLMLNCPGRTWGDADETKRAVQEMADTERRARHKKTVALRALRLSKALASRD